MFCKQFPSTRQQKGQIAVASKKQTRGLSITGLLLELLWDLIFQ
jgi:hypothetical protein